MANLSSLNQSSNPVWDLLREIGGIYGITGPDQRPPPYTQGGSQQNQGNGQAQERSQEQPPQPEPEGPSSNMEQEESFGYPGCRRGRGRGRGRGGCRGRGRPFARRGWPHAHHHGRPFPFPMPGQTQSNENDGQGNANFNDFLQNLGSSIGTNLRDIIQETNKSATDNPEVDFVPRADVFDTPAEYLVHVSLPGAQKQDISVDYDAGSSTLHLAGVVSRPGINESLSASLVVPGRDREVGVFERQVHLGTRNQPARVDVELLNAKMADGILIVKLPKETEQEQPSTKKVPVTYVGKDSNNGQGKEPESMSDEKVPTSESKPQDATESHAASVHEEEEESDYVTVDVD